MLDGDPSELGRWAPTRLTYLDNLEVVLIAAVIALHVVLGHPGSLRCGPSDPGVPDSGLVGAQEPAGTVLYKCHHYLQATYYPWSKIHIRANGTGYSPGGYVTILLRVLGVVIFFVVLLLAFGRLFGPVELVIWAALLVAAVVFTIRWSRRHRPTVAR